MFLIFTESQVLEQACSSGDPMTNSAPKASFDRTVMSQINLPEMGLKSICLVDLVRERNNGFPCILYIHLIVLLPHVYSEAAYTSENLSETIFVS